jgi:hypothetical protein
MDAWEETVDVPGRQHGNKRPWRQMASISEEGQDNSERHQKLELRTAITSKKRRKTQKDRI